MSLVLTRSVPVALIGGVLAWIGAAIFLIPSDPFAELRGRADTQLLVEDLTRVQDQLDRLAEHIRQIREPFLKNGLKQIHDSASVMVEEVRRDPADWKIVRKALLVYLEHAVSLGAGVRNVSAIRAVDPAVQRRLEEALSDLKQVFEDYRHRMADKDELRLQVDLDVLRGEVLGDLPRPLTPAAEPVQQVMPPDPLQPPKAMPPAEAAPPPPPLPFPMDPIRQHQPESDRS